MEENKKIITIGDERYYPAEEFEREIEFLMKFVHNATIDSIAALVMSSVAIILSILL